MRAAHVVSVGSEEVLDHVMLRDEACHRRRVGLVADLQRRGLLRVQAEDRVQEPIVLPPHNHVSHRQPGARGTGAETIGDRVVWLWWWLWCCADLAAGLRVPLDLHHVLKDLAPVELEGDVQSAAGRRHV